MRASPTPIGRNVGVYRASRTVWSKSYKDYIDEGIAQIEEFVRNDGKMIHEDEETFKARKKKEMMKCKSLKHLKNFTKKFGLVPDEKVLPREEREAKQIDENIRSEEIPF